MTWTDELFDRVAAQIPCGYHPTGPAASEPTALAALALSVAGRSAAAPVQLQKALAWLAAHQAAEGSIGATDDPASPGWPTGWAILAALAAKANRGEAKPQAKGSGFDVPRAVNWLLQTAGEGMPRTSDVGHDASLVGWPWVAGTHSWVEPTAISVLALKAAGQGNHPRTREAVFLLTDRLLTGGGCNYGNTIVLGQELRPHVEPTGLALLALAGEPNQDGRIGRSLDYLLATLSAQTTAVSLSYGLLGLAAYHRLPAAAPQWLQAAYGRTLARDAAAYPLALLALASLGERSPLMPRVSVGEAVGTV